MRLPHFHPYSDEIKPLKAGSSTIVASLWSVSDESTAKLMKYFYRQLKEGKSEAPALQQAQVKLMEEYPHPFYWAPFIVIGRSVGE